MGYNPMPDDAGAAPDENRAKQAFQGRTPSRKHLASQTSLIG
jgi:hypothetical protein